MGDFASYSRVQDRQLDNNEMNLRIRQLVDVVRPEAQAAFKKAQAKSRAANAVQASPDDTSSFGGCKGHAAKPGQVRET